MAGLDKIKISSDFIFTKIFISGGLVITLLLLQDYKKVAASIFAEYVFLIIILATLLVYFFTRPAVSYNATHFFIKKMQKEEVAVPLSNIHTVTQDIFTSFTRRGVKSYVIRYSTLEKKDVKVKFQVDFNSEEFAGFITQLKKAKPSAKIS